MNRSDRIKACVNACAGISDNELTHGPVISLQRYSTLANQRDELRKSLSHLIEICRVKCGPNDEPILPGISNHQALVSAAEVLARSES